MSLLRFHQQNRRRVSATGGAAIGDQPPICKQPCCLLCDVDMARREHETRAQWVARIGVLYRSSAFHGRPMGGD